MNDSGSFGAIHADRVIPFESLYLVVTKNLEAYVDTDPDLSGGERKWLTYLGSAFRARYRNWLTEEITYLQKLYTQDWDTFTLTAHIYLHICVDLTLVLLESFRLRGDDGEPLVTRTRGRAIFQRIEAAFETAIHANWKKTHLIRILSSRVLEFDTLFIGWAAGLRNTAWDLATELHTLKPPDQDSLIRGLRQDVQSKMESALQRFWLWAKIFSLRAPTVASIGYTQPIEQLWPHWISRLVFRSLFRVFGSPNLAILVNRKADF